MKGTILKIDDLLEDRKYDLHWQMTRCERLVVRKLLESLKPSLAIEIGTYKGGSLQVIAEYSKSVISLDTNPDLEKELGTRFPNVRFVSGYSQQTLPEIVDDLNNRSESPEFVLVDGDHSEEGVRQDVNFILQIRPQRPMVILMHDGFNPDCRQGMLTADWHSCPFVQSVDVDFVGGLFSENSFDTAEAGSMWSGLGAALLTPQARIDELQIRQSQRRVCEAVTGISIHKSTATESTASGGIARTLLRRLTRRHG